MDSKIFNIYKIESDILEKCMELVKVMAQDGVGIYYISSSCDKYIKEELNKIYKNKKRGLALPTCISVNKKVAHYSPTELDNQKLATGDLIRVEMACYIDKYVSSLGDTIKVGNTDFNESDDYIAAKLALSTGIKHIEPFMEIKKFDEILKKVGKCYGLQLLERPYVFNEEDATLQYDWARRDDNKFLEQSWVVKCDQDLDLEDLSDLDEEKYELDTHFNVGDIYHLEVAFTKSNILPSVSETKGNLYQRTYINHGLRSKYGKKVLGNISKNIGDYFFKINDIEDMTESQIKLGINECQRHHIIRELGIIESKTNDVIRLKCTIAVQENSVYVLTGKENISFKPSENLSNELVKILKQPSKFSKREIILENKV